jgi:hypothetical protein
MSAPALDQREIERIARAYPPDARFTPEWVRERHFTDAQRGAWELRFGQNRLNRLPAFLAVGARQ